MAYYAKLLTPNPATNLELLDLADPAGEGERLPAPPDRGDPERDLEPDRERDREREADLDPAADRAEPDADLQSTNIISIGL